MTKRSVTHASFTIERAYDLPPARVFAGFANPEAKRRWLIGGEGWQVEAYEPAFAVNAFERSRFRFKGGPLIANDTVYLEILPEQRLVFAYTMALEGATMSSSLVTVQFEPAGKGTRLVFTEQGAYVDGFDDVTGRENGTRELLEALAKELGSHAPA